MTEKRKMTRRRVSGEKGGLIGIAMLFLNTGLLVVIGLVSVPGVGAYCRVVVGFALICTGFSLLVSRESKKLNRWHPDHLEIVTPAELKLHQKAIKKAAEEQKKLEKKDPELAKAVEEDKK
jgi:hypothetical protein